MKISFFSMICTFLCAILQFVAYIHSRDSLYLTIAAGFVILGILHIRNMIKAEAKEAKDE